MDYGAKHSEALSKVRKRGAAVEFTYSTPGAYNPATDTTAPPTTVNAPGFAVEVPGDPEQYEAMELIGTEAVTLFFVPTVFGTLPELNHYVQWAGVKRTVQNISPIRPAGVAIAARVIVV